MRLSRLVLVATLVVAAGLFAAASPAAADNNGPQEVNVTLTGIDGTVYEGDGQTVEIEVTNPEEDELTFPLVEIPLDDLDIPDERLDEDNFVTEDRVIVDIEDGGEEPRTAYIDDSTFRSTNALFIEGEEIEAEETRTYAVNLTIETASSIEVEADVRPLNAEANNVRKSDTANPIGTGTVEIAGEGEAEIDGDRLVEPVQATGEQSVSGDSEYDVSPDVSLFDNGAITFEDITVDEFGTETITVSDPEEGEAETPTVVAQTGESAVIEDSEFRDFEQHTIGQPVIQRVGFNLDADGGETVLAVEDEPTLPMTKIDGNDNTFSVTEWTDLDDESGVARLETAETVDGNIVWVDLKGYHLGDVNLDDDVTEGDAQTVAENVAEDSTDDLTAYGDVDDDEEITAVDAMKIQQHLEEED